MYLPDHDGSIGVFDSGIGGLTVANAVSGHLPGENLLYVADNARAPYGFRSAREILNYSHDLTAFLLKAGVKLIVVACNTATSLAIDALRKTYPDVPFVGLEPAIKPAATDGRVGVMATRATLASPRYQQLKERFLPRGVAWESPCEGLVEAIEVFGSGSPEVVACLQQILGGTAGGQSGQRVDSIVLGCTHFPLVSDDIASVVGPATRIIEPSTAAASQVGRLLDQHGLNAAITSERASYDFFSTGGPAPLQRTLLQLPNLNRHRRWLVPYLALAK